MQNKVELKPNSHDLFIEKIQNEDKSLITNNAVIEKADNGKIHISTNLTLNFINLWLKRLF